MNAQPKPAIASQWTVEENEYGTTLNLHDGSSPVSLPIGRPWFVFATIIVDAHNAAIAAEQRRADDSIVENVRQQNEISALREQLAAERKKHNRQVKMLEQLAVDLPSNQELYDERKKVQTLVDALHYYADDSYDSKRAKDALVRVAK